MTKNDAKVVLLVEDELPLINAIKKKLERNDFQVVTARKVDQALNLIEELDRVDVIWLDHYLLGQEDGLDFLAKIKSDGIRKSIPVFVVSNTASPRKVSAYLELGADKYYTKADYRLDSIIDDIKKRLNE